MRFQASGIDSGRQGGQHAGLVIVPVPAVVAVPVPDPACFAPPEPECPAAVSGSLTASCVDLTAFYLLQ